MTDACGHGRQRHGWPGLCMYVEGVCNEGVCWGVGVSLCPMQKKWRSATDGSGIVPQHQQLPAAPAASALTTLTTTHTNTHTHTTELSNSQQSLLQLSLLMKVQLCVHHNIINMFCAVLQSRYHHTVIPSTVNLIQFNKNDFTFSNRSKKT